MPGLHQYVFRLICATVICALVPEFFEKSSAQHKLIRFIGGIMMMLVAIGPILGKEIWKIDWYSENLANNSAYAIEEGQAEAESMLRQIITEQTQAYILDKAAGMGAELSAEVILTDSVPPEPDAVILTGAVSPYIRQRLSGILVSELAISKEKLVWK